VGEVYIGSTFTYEITYENSNPYDVTNVTILDTLPPELDFISATHDGVYDPVTHTVLWNIGTIPAGTVGPTIELVVKVNQSAVPGDTIQNYATIDAEEVPPTTVEDDEGSEDPGDEPGTPIGESIPVAVDIEPASCPNPLNTKSGGVLPVAILGSEEFDVSTIDASTVLLADVPPVRWNVEDVATPFDGDVCDCHDLNGDGYLDLTLKFKRREIVTALGLGELCGETIPLALTGNLEGGTPIVGQDCVWVLAEICDNGIDDDYDGLVDAADADCSLGPCAETAEASVYDGSNVYGSSGLYKHLTYLLLPLGAVIALGIWRRKR
jgi:uncharacterized repeat protein (TIGR01451 family)